MRPYIKQRQKYFIKAHALLYTGLLNTILQEDLVYLPLPSQNHVLYLLSHQPVGNKCTHMYTKQLTIL